MAIASIADNPAALITAAFETLMINLLGREAGLRDDTDDYGARDHANESSSTSLIT